VPSDAAGEPSGPAASSPDYVVVDVADGSAVIQGLGGVRQIRRGAVLPGIGRVTAIERIGTEWVVLGSGRRHPRAAVTPPRLARCSPPCFDMRRDACSHVQQSGGWVG
jgi:hypothetical protein